MTQLQIQIREKRSILREEYGGLMNMSELSRELNVKPETARQWAMEQGICIQIGKRIKADTDSVARILVQKRGMC